MATTESTTVAIGTIPRSRTILSYCCATLLTYLGLVHEVVGSRLYPDGAAKLGGPLVWHSLGVGALLGGVLIMWCIGGGRRVAAVVIAAAFVLVTAGIMIWAAMVERDFHFFAFTGLLTAAVLIAAQARPAGAASR